MNGSEDHGDNVAPPEDDAAAMADGAITLWSNLVTMFGMQLLEMGSSRADVLEMLRMLHETNEETVQSPRARAAAARHLTAVYRVLAEA